MTTLRDILRDIAKDTRVDIIRLNEDMDIATPTDEELEDKVEEYMEMIQRIIG